MTWAKRMMTGTLWVMAVWVILVTLGTVIRFMVGWTRWVVEGLLIG